MIKRSCTLVDVLTNAFSRYSHYYTISECSPGQDRGIYSPVGNYLYCVPPHIFLLHEHSSTTYEIQIHSYYLYLLWYYLPASAPVVVQNWWSVFTCRTTPRGNMRVPAYIHLRTWEIYQNRIVGHVVPHSLLGIAGLLGLTVYLFRKAQPIKPWCRTPSWPRLTWGSSDETSHLGWVESIRKCRKHASGTRVRWQGREAWISGWLSRSILVFREAWRYERSLYFLRAFQAVPRYSVCRSESSVVRIQTAIFRVHALYKLSKFWSPSRWSWAALGV